MHKPALWKRKGSCTILQDVLAGTTLMLKGSKIRVKQTRNAFDIALDWMHQPAIEDGLLVKQSLH
jgi:hypothetical protein